MRARAVLLMRNYSRACAVLAALAVIVASLTAVALSARWQGLGLAGTVASFLALLAIMTDANRRAIQAQEAKLSIALNNITQGLCMFDANARLVLFNQRYLEMYQFPPDSVSPGCTLRDLLVLRKAAGSFSGDPDDYVAKRMANHNEGKISDATIELDDGRVIKMVNHPIANGGWVATHEDVTELYRRESELARTRKFLDMVIDNVPAAISVKDARDLSYVLVNRAGEEIYGFSREQMIGKTVSQLFPDRPSQIITARDRQVLESRTPQAFGEHTYQSPRRGPRIHLSRRVPVLNEKGDPRYLLLVIQDITEQKEAEARATHLALHDPLTELPNRVAFNENLAESLQRCEQAHRKLAVLSINLDRFKEINDVYGHGIGDELLRAVAKRLPAVADGAFFARTGGDEFSFIIADDKLPTSANWLGECLLAATAEPFDIQGHHLHVGLSIGIAVYPGDGVDAATLLANADAALYRAKAEGRGSLRFFEADMDRQLRERRALTQDLRSAIVRDELILHYQPLALINGEVVGFEALLRWMHPTQGMIAPGKFIPLAEESGLIIEIGEWVLRAACREAASWPLPLRISVNLSPAQFQHGDLVGLVHSVLLETGLAAARLEIEITESVLVEDFARVVSILRRLKALGLHIAMDDFGTGYSSLQNLQSFPFDKLKIDRSFISNLESNAQSATIVRAVIGLGRSLGVPVVAEGVETTTQLEFLKSELCDEIQGFLIGRPQLIGTYATMVGRRGKIRRMPKKPAAA